MFLDGDSFIKMDWNKLYFCLSRFIAHASRLHHYYRASLISTGY